MIRNQYPLFFASIVALSISASAEKVLLETDFDSRGEATASRILGHPLTELASGVGKDGSDAVRVIYEGNEKGSTPVVVPVPLEGATDFAVLEFDVKFEDGFDFARGGKMHGVGPEKPVTGGRAKRPDGWSSRIMWKADGYAITYLYDQDTSRRYGRTDNTTKSVFEKGKWHQVKIVTQLNDPGEANGFAELYVDGEKVVETREVEFRGEGGDHTLISRFMFNTFHGGNNPSWAPKDEEGNYITVTALFDNIRVTAKALE